MIQLENVKSLIVTQVYEIAEFLGFETRNKYEIKDNNSQIVAYAAEQQKGIFSFLLRQFLGHWRQFDIYIFNLQRELQIKAHHPFRFIFQRLEITSNSNMYLGAIQQRFSILHKRFDIQNSRGQVIFEVASPIWKIWTFEFLQRGIRAATVQKKWSGLFTEIFSDKDNFLVDFSSSNLTLEDKNLVLAAALFIDLKYFENKAGDN